MDLSNLMLEKDFYKLNGNDISALIKELKVNIEKSDEGKKYVYEERNNFFGRSDKATEIILNKIFVGQRISVKWYKIHELDIERKKEILHTLERFPYYRKFKSVNTKTVNMTTCIGCYKLSNDKYIFRYLVPDREIKKDDGLTIHREKIIKNVIAIIDFQNRFIEIRSGSSTAKKVLEEIISQTGLTETGEHVVLYRYGNSLEAFRDSLEEGWFKNFKAAPKTLTDLTEEDTKALIDTLEAMDEFFLNRDYDLLVDSLSKIDFDADESNFTQIFLAGMAKIGMSISKDSSEDMSLQPIYRMLDKYINNESGFIGFKNPNDGNCYTIQVGLTTNSIYFPGESSESAIAYIRDKLL